MKCTSRYWATRTLAIAAAVLQGACALTPTPLETGEVAAFSSDLIAKTAAGPEPVPGEMDVYDAIARAIKFNADIRVKEFEIAVADAGARVQNAALLPNIVADSSYYGRGRKDSSYSSLSPSSGASSDLALSWDILDFGLSYVRAGQAADKALYQTAGPLALQVLNLLNAFANNCISTFRRMR